jgi:tetratricopeptide (TPR) repeat protein
MSRFLGSRFLFAILLTGALLQPARLLASNEPRWIRLDSTHFSVLTDADEKKGREVIVRFEQMRAVFAQLLYKSRINLSEPIDIIALKSDEEYSRVAPARQGAGLGAAFVIPGEDRCYFVLNVSQGDSWRAISAGFAKLLLKYNYPPTQSWFDDGFAGYFSSLQLSDKEMQIGGDPGQAAAQPYAALLNQSNWLDLAGLFNTAGNNGEQGGSHQALFQAESWIVMHYLLNKEKLPAAGAYFGLVENEKLPTEQAVQKAFGVSAVQLLQAVKDYFHSMASTLQQTGKTPAGSFQNAVPAPVSADVIGNGSHQIPEGEAQALVAEMTLRVPEHRVEAQKQLAAIVDQPKMDNLVAHRALAWDAMEQKNYEQAVEELGNAVTIDNKDPMTHYYLALYKYQEAKSSGGEMKGLANMMQDLHVVLDLDHEFAEAYYMLGVAQTEGGGLRAATDSVRAAIELSPRRPDYLLELARIYEAGKHWDAATALLERLAGNSNSEVASGAKQDLHDLPYIKKYGIPPAADAASAGEQKSLSGGSSSMSSPASQQSDAVAKQTATSDEGDDTSQLPVAAPQIDKRPIQYARGKLIAVDCSQAPAAIVTITAGARTMKLRTSDYKSLMLVGEDTFSCDWTNRPASANYKAGGKTDGDLVSLEVH